MPSNLFTIGEAAARAGVSADTVRYYERQGVLPRALRTDAGYRVYSDATVERIRLVKNAVGFGFAVKQVAAFLHACDEGQPPCRKVRQSGSELLAEMDRRLAEMTAARDHMRGILDEWDQTLASTPRGVPARLLSSLPAASKTRSISRNAREHRR
jgi:DNA-binding transcriptional MerR regulator